MALLTLLIISSITIAILKMTCSEPTALHCSMGIAGFCGVMIATWVYWHLIMKHEYKKLEK